MRKRILQFFAAFCLLAFSVCTAGYTDARAADIQEDTEFFGSRCVRFAADKSDVDNFINGGRPALDLALRKSTPSWLVYKLASDGRDLSLTLSFDFESYEDYEKKLEQLLGHEPYNVYKNDGGIYLMESFNAEALLNFVGLTLNEEENLSEFQLNQIFSADENKMTLNSKDYVFERRVSINPDGAAAVKADALSVRTAVDSDGVYRRTIEMEIDTKYAPESDVDRAEEQFETLGDVKRETLSDTRYALSVEFEAQNIGGLSEKTMSGLNAAVSVSERESYKDDDTVSVARTEYFDTEALLRNTSGEAVAFGAEGGTIEPSKFYFEFFYPEASDSLSSDNEAVTVADGYVAARDEAMITYNYEKPFSFSEVYMTTRKDSLFGKINREIVYKLPVTVAGAYHETVRAQFEKSLADGMVFDIYDEGTVRYYKISYSSYFQKDIIAFTDSIREAGGMEIRDDGVTLSGIRKYEKLTVICGAAVIAVVILIIIIVKIRKLVKHLKSRRNGRKAAETPARGWYCSQCGNYNEPDYRFCARCGSQKREK